LDDVEVAAGRGPEARDRAEARALGVEDLHADDLIIIVFVIRERRQIAFRDAHDGADPLLRVVDAVDAVEMNQQLTLVRLDARKADRRARAVFFQENFFRGEKGRALGIVGR
jgi:hypothetical protein